MYYHLFIRISYDAGLELVSPCPFPATIIITPRAPPREIVILIVLCIHIFLLPLLGVIFPITLKKYSLKEMSNSAKCNLFILAETVRYLVYVFICLFLGPTEDSHYYWHSVRFKVSHLFFSNSISKFLYLLIWTLWLICYYLFAMIYNLEGMIFYNP